MFGILNLNKPPGMSSRDVVNVVKRLVKPEKLGHAGTLDPIATGVLVVCIGQATRLVPYIQEPSKTYIAEFLLGVTSESDDIEQEVVPLVDAKTISLEELNAVLPRFIGRIDQVPPAFSAVKINGQRAYKLARKGNQVEITPRPVNIHRIEVLALSTEKMQLEVECGSGTYIRSLGRDIAKALGSGAVMSALSRTAIGLFSITDAVEPRQLMPDTLAQYLISPLRALTDFVRCEVTEEEIPLVRQGLRVPFRPLNEPPADEESEPPRYAIVDPGGQLLAIAQRQDADTTTPLLAPKQVFC